MPTAPPPALDLEAERLSVLRQYRILDTPSEEVFDSLAELAAQTCAAPIACISFLDEHRVYYKATLGFSLSELPRPLSLSAHVTCQTGVFHVADAGAEPAFASLPLVQGAPHIRFFAGVPLRSPAGHALGCLCVAAPEPRPLPPDQHRWLTILARQVSAQLELRRSLTELNVRHDQVQGALQHSEAFYSSLCESLPQNVFRKDLEGRFTYANPKFCTTLGRRPEAILGRTDFDFFPEALAQKYQADDREVLRTRATFDAVEEHRTPDQPRLFVRVVKTPVLDARGEALGIQGIFWDVTEEKTLAESLAHERDLLRTLLHNVPDTIYFKDLQSRFIRCSDSLASHCGLTGAQTAIGKTDFELFTEEHARQAFTDEQRIIRTGEPLVNATEKETRKDGTVTWVSTTKMPFRNQEGKIIGTFGISRDITEMKRIQVEIEQARDAALTSARLKSEFLANMSHEIRTPMNAIIGMTGLLLDTELSPEQMEFAETVRNSADSLLTIINDILDFSKIEARKLALEIINFNLRDVVEGTAELLAERAQNKGIELIASVPEDVPVLLRGDPGRLRQILMNLVSNAIKFTERGEVVVRVAKAEETPTHLMVRFEVHDTGIGVPAHAQGFLFQPFSQVDGSTTRRYGGTGLGLAISRQLAELMMGQIGVESTGGSGSVFWFTVRLEKQPDGDLFDALPRSDLVGLKVLVVDDNETNRQILLHQTRAWQMQSEAVASGSAAIAVLRLAAEGHQPYALALLDMQMPELDGLMVARRVKADPSIAATRLVILTSMGHRVSAAELQAAGVVAFLVKPVKQSQLFDSLANVMSERGSLAPRSLSASTAAATPGTPLAVPLAIHRNLRLLLAEDNIANQKVALRQIRKLGYAVDAVANGLEVLEALRKIHYDIILMDCQMPELDGYDATRQIRQMEAAPAARPAIRPRCIIAMTANAIKGDREKCLEAGMDDYISKPVKLQELAEVLGRWSQAVQRHTPTPEPAPSTPDPA